MIHFVLRTPSIPTTILRQNKDRRRAKPRALVPRPVAAQVHKFKRTYQANYQVADSFIHRGTAFALNLLPNYTEFTALFDAYRIMRIDGLFIYDANSAGVSSQVGYSPSYLPNLLLVNDFDDGNALTAVTDYEQYESFRVVRLDQQHRITFIPQIAVGAYGGAVFTNYARQRGIWLDAASPAVEHYGIKFGVDGSMEGGAGTHNLGTLKIYWTAHLELRDTR